MPEIRQEHPPVPHLVVRVGVTGHREGPDLASTELRAAVRQTLLDIQAIAGALLERSKGVYIGNKPVLRVISPLAEGADRLVAEEALVLGYELQSPLPFHKSEYEEDFQAPGSVAKFNELLSRATAVLELDGSRKTKELKDEAYEAVGHLVLRQCDVLIAIWDGQQARGIGGTAQIVESARSIEIPTIRIDPAAPRVIELLSTDNAPATIDSIEERLSLLLLPPSKGEDALRHFLFIERLRRRDEAPELPRELQHSEDSILRSAFTWADRLANHYAQKYHRSYKAIYLLGAMAVLFAYLGSIQPVESLAHKTYLIAELATIGLIGLIALPGRSNHWHERWLDRRHLAESLRMMRLLALFGRVTPDFQVPAHLEKGDPRKTWFHWYLRALARQVGLVTASMTPEHLGMLRRFLSRDVADQVEYHTDKAEHARHQHHLLHQMAQGSFFVAAIACLLHFFIHEPPLLTPLNLLVIVLPAFGAAIGAILNQGEAERIARRSEALKERLAKLQTDLTRLGDAPSSRELGRLVESFSRIYLAELMDWRFLFLDRPLTLPA